MEGAFLFLRSRFVSFFSPSSYSSFFTLFSSAFVQALKRFVHAQKKPVWGTCAGKKVSSGSSSSFSLLTLASIPLPLCPLAHSRLLAGIFLSSSLCCLFFLFFSAVMQLLSSSSLSSSSRFLVQVAFFSRTRFVSERTSNRPRGLTRGQLLRMNISTSTAAVAGLLLLLLLSLLPVAKAEKGKKKKKLRARSERRMPAELSWEGSP